MKKKPPKLRTRHLGIKVEENKHKSIKQREQLEGYLDDFEEETKRIEDLAKQLDEISSKYIDKKK